ncbi:MAG TPA: hypothetical protein VFH27_00395 [Longimicrobiaceae bacterium]|nr:hypothetical protein [Longimicrobiaceae bacterium]
MLRSTLLAGAAAGLLSLAACSDAVGPASSALSADEAQALGLSMAGLTTDALGDAFTGPGSADRIANGPSADVITTNESFSRTRACPAGGTVTVSGTRQGTYDTTAKTGSWSETATRVDAACAHTVRAGVTVTVTGAPNVALTSSHSRTAGVAGVWTHTEKGAFDWTRGEGKSGHCTVDVTSTFNPATHTLHVSGTICNRTFDRTVTRTT